MARPSNATVSVDGNSFNALSTHFGVASHHSFNGVPQMGSLMCTIDVTIDMHDADNLPYATLQKLFTLASNVTKDAIKDIKITFWTDESQTDAICTYTFRGWISSFTSTSGGGSNHTLNLSLQPALDDKQFVNISMGN
jgi:hypothetical protein